MSTTTTCKACCPVDLLIPDDFDYGTLFYATQGYSFVIDCPPGFYCQPGFPITVTIPPGEIPPVHVPVNVPTGGGSVILRGCSGFITGIVIPGSSPFVLGQIIASMQQRWAQMQANCDVISGLTPLPGNLAVEVGNDEQCYTTNSGTCPPGETQKAPVTNCIPEGTFTKDLVGVPTVAQYQAAKALLNSQAALKAQNNAEAAQVCGWFNATNTYTIGCPCSPGCGIFGPFGWMWNGGEFFSTVSQADANQQAFCGALIELNKLCVASGCPNCTAATPCP